MTTQTTDSIVPGMSQEEFDVLPRAHKKRLYRAHREDTRVVTIGGKPTTRTSVLTPQRMMNTELEASKEMLAKIERGELTWNEALSTPQSGTKGE